MIFDPSRSLRLCEPELEAGRPVRIVTDSGYSIGSLHAHFPSGP
jgi:hypothetical protein